MTLVPHIVIGECNDLQSQRETLLGYIARVGEREGERGVEREIGRRRGGQTKMNVVPLLLFLTLGTNQR